MNKMNKRSRSTASPNPDADKIEQERKMDEEYRTEQLTAAKRRLPTQSKQTTPIIHALVSDMSQSASSSSSSFPTTAIAPTATAATNPASSSTYPQITDNTTCLFAVIPIHRSGGGSNNS
jgi:hypothetical protein